MINLFQRGWARFHNMLNEYKLGINTRGTAEVNEADAVHYATINYSAIWAILNCLELRPSDVFVDLGCGKGRVVCCASRFNMKAVIGVEVETQLCDIAKANAARVRERRSSITIVNSPVQNFEYSIGTVFYLFNPFGIATLKTVLAKLEQSLRENPRRIRIVYVFPAHEALLRESGWLENECRWDVRSDVRFQHNVSFWKSREISAAKQLHYHN